MKWVGERKVSRAGGTLSVFFLGNAMCSTLHLLKSRASSRLASFAGPQAFLAHLLPFKGYTDVVREIGERNTSSRSAACGQNCGACFGLDSESCCCLIVPGAASRKESEQRVAELLRWLLPSHP